MSEHSLDWGWKRVTAACRLTQGDLFPRGRDEMLMLMGISTDEATRWWERKWLSFDIMEFDVLEAPLWNELAFIRNLAQSGFPEAIIKGLLKKLEPTYRYDPVRTAYSFAEGWVQLPVGPSDEELDSFIREVLPAWAWERAITGDVELLDEVLMELRWKVAEARALRKGKGQDGE